MQLSDNNSQVKEKNEVIYDMLEKIKSKQSSSPPTQNKQDRFPDNEVEFDYGQ